MAKFKVGDRVRIKDDAPRRFAGHSVGVTGKITEAYNYEPNCWNILADNGDGTYYNHEEDMELLSSTKNIMSNIIDTIRLKKLGEPKKSLVKAGITNLDGSVTSDGRVILEEFLVNKYQDDLKKEYADDIIAEQEKANK